MTFIVNGVEVDANGKPLNQAAPVNPLDAELQSVRSDFMKYQNDLPGLKARVAELEAAEAEAKSAKSAKPAGK